MPKFMIKEMLWQYYIVEADTEDKAIQKLYDGEGSIDPVDAVYSDDVIAWEMTNA